MNSPQKQSTVVPVLYWIVSLVVSWIVIAMSWRSTSTAILLGVGVAVAGILLRYFSTWEQAAGNVFYVAIHLAIIGSHRKTLDDLRRTNEELQNALDNEKARQDRGLPAKPIM